MLPQSSFSFFQFCFLHNKQEIPLEFGLKIGMIVSVLPRLMKTFDCAWSMVSVLRL